VSEINLFNGLLGQRMKSWVDEKTNEIVTRCEVCGAMAWHAKDQLDALPLQHTETCAVAFETGPALGPSSSSPLGGEPSSDVQDLNEQVLLIKRGLWEGLIDINRDLILGRSAYLECARRLAERVRSGEQLPSAKLDALMEGLTGGIDPQERDLETLRRLRLIPQPAPLPANLQAHTSLGDAAVIAPKALFDKMGQVAEGAFEMAEELACDLTELLDDVESGDRPEPQVLSAMADALFNAKEALADTRAMFRKWMGRLALMTSDEGLTV
jgi:hypothetical protein